MIEGTNNVRYVAGELAYSELLEMRARSRGGTINSDANTISRNLGSPQCAQCTISVWSLRH